MEQTELKKGTSIDWLMTQLYKKGFIKEIDGNEPIILMNQAKEMEKQQTIEFAEWCLSELLNGNEPKAETMQGLLEIFKNK